MRISDWSSDVCSSDLNSKSSRSRFRVAFRLASICSGVLILVVILGNFVEEVIGRLDRVFDLGGGLGLEQGQQATSGFNFPLSALRRPQYRHASRQSLLCQWVVGQVNCGRSEEHTSEL